MQLNAEMLLQGYANGAFPMAEASGQIYWYAPDPRAIIPIGNYKPSRSLRPVINQKVFEIKLDTCFKEVMRCCARPRFAGDETWISEEIIRAYCDLHEIGLAHSVEAYFENELVGGLYGVALGAAFFGESMFFEKSNASKVAFHYLIEVLRKNNFQLLDTQFMNDNVERYGAIEIPKAVYEARLIEALQTSCRFEL
ncbi:leucyl/phenylalanyl-tRNA--protein transferase [Jiulongibacter sediminis]|uniref:Leucyl/phenylalanyl-tRNA--protein transferase n=1 Tax=Jiulongibacter sediminis TaxID=1605367 RepID=A0A0P7BA26_9BACT|nr:leucyl/phenylalanyl-tRNA--protein transferase [Jiulongibacter sediminis]KPM47195.1 leucyl/phenylalanyl-tRNA--protein transferase [Jiulongibacter sediminis]TBX22753.1 leucyl/phenylalanyl-tRNA--protein transferase [Jiulongibacter sediminis]